MIEEAQRPPLPAPDLEGAVEVSKGRKLKYQCYGSGSPTIIIEAGAGDKPTMTRSWNAVILGVMPTTRICIYDRVDVNTVQDGAENLHLLLTTVPIPGPYILVAHSLGGWYARLFTHLYRNEMAGLILVDTSPTAPEAGIIYATAYPTYSPGELASITKNRLPEADISRMPPSLDGLDMAVSNEQVRQAGSLGDLPLIVMCHTLGLLELSDYDPLIHDQISAIFIQIAADQAKLSTRGVFIQAHTHQHFISEYEPQIVIDAINRMVEDLRKK
jgi:pimeloyl-ACP methyl ester carboxylesterase